MLATMKTQIHSSQVTSDVGGSIVWLRITGVAIFALAAGLSAHVVIPLPHTPVPITLQTLVVLLAGATLGSRYGTLSMAFYLLLGTTGYHVFAGGEWGLQTVFGPTGGYLLGFVLAQPIIGRLTRSQYQEYCPARRTQRWLTTLLAMLCGTLIIFGCGLTWLYVWSGQGVSQTLAWGLWPFLPGLVIKTLLAAGAVQIIPTSVRRWFE